MTIAEDGLLKHPARVSGVQNELTQRERKAGLAGTTGLEPATSDVTGRRSNQLNYDSAKNCFRLVGTEGFEPPTSSL